MKAIRIAGLLAVVLAAYSNHFSNGFHFDDAHTVVDNPHIRKLENIPRFFEDPALFSKLPTHQVYRPVLSSSLALDYRIGGGLEPWAFHLSTFVLYCVLLLVLYAFYGRLTGSDDVALFGAAVFGLHPVSAETVNYIIQRADLYTALGVTAAIWLYAWRPSWRRYGLYLIPFFLAALSKPITLIFPALLLLYCLVYERQGWRAAAAAVTPALATTAALGLLLSRMTGPGFAPGGGPRGIYWLTQTWVSFEYFLAFFWPAHLSADSDERLLAGVTPQAILGIVFVAAAAAGAALLARSQRWRPAGFGLAWFLIALLPTAAVPLSEVSNDHRMFFPFVGLTLAASWTLWQFIGARRMWMAAAAVLILTSAAWATRQRNEVWRTEETLWRDVTEKSPGNGRGWMNYGLTLVSRGEHRTALACFERATRLTPNYPLLEINMGIVKNLLGRAAESEAHFQRALALDSAISASHFFYGRWLLEKARYNEAAAQLERSLEIEPADLNAMHLLMKVHFDQQNWNALRKLAADALRIDPADSAAQQYQVQLASLDTQIAAQEAEAASKKTPEAWLNLSLSYYRTGRFEDCVRASRRALELRPNYADALNNLAAANNAMHRWDEGIAAAEQAIRLDASNQLARNNLAWARAEKERGGR